MRAYWLRDSVKRVDELGSEAMTDTHKHIFYTTVQALRQRSSNNHSIMVAHNNRQANFVSERERAYDQENSTRRVDDCGGHMTVTESTPSQHNHLSNIVLPLLKKGFCLPTW